MKTEAEKEISLLSGLRECGGERRKRDKGRGADRK